MESGSAVRTGIADGSHDLVQRGDTSFRRGSRERVPPSFLAGSVPSVRIRTVAPVTVVFAFGHRVCSMRIPKAHPSRDR